MKAFIPALLISAATLSACAEIPLAPQSLISKTQFSDQNVQVTSINEKRLPDGTLKLAVYGKSISQFDKVVRYRVRWYDSSNTPITTALDNWLEMNVAGNAPFDFAAISPGARAARYVVEFETH